jgi:hypothetical protein
MTETTPRFQLPLLASGQAQKEIVHNEALWRADFMIQPIVETVGENTPPTSPAPGQAWVIGTQPVGDWTGKTHHIALWTDGGWRFIVPFEDVCVFHKTLKINYCFQGGLWLKQSLNAASFTVDGVTVLNQRQPSIGSPTSGVVVDAECRIAVNQILTAMRNHGLIAQ